MTPRDTDAIAQIPRNCVCTWSWSGGRWVRQRAEDNCPWHLGRRAQ